MKLTFLEKELNKKFSSYSRKGYIELHTKSKRIAKKYGFLEDAKQEFDELQQKHD